MRTGTVLPSRMLFLLSGGMACLLLPACNLVVAGVAAPSLLKQEKVNLVNATHASTDILVQASHGRFDRQTALLIVQDFEEDVDLSKKKPVANPELGRVLAGQMRTRFLELGYNLSPNIYTKQGHEKVSVHGTYAIRGTKMSVYVRMIKDNTGEILAVHEYSLPATYDIKRYMYQGDGGVHAIPHIL